MSLILVEVLWENVREYLPKTEILEWFIYVDAVLDE